MNKIPKSLIVGFLASYVAASLFIGGLGFLIQYYYMSEIPQLTSLMNNGRTTTAKIEKIENDNRGTIHFSYQLDGGRYTGLAYHRSAGYSRGELHPGQSITILYDPTAPDEGYFLNLEPRLESEYQQLWFVTFAMPIMAVWLPFLAFAVLYIKVLLPNSQQSH